MLEFIDGNTTERRRVWQNQRKTVGTNKLASVNEEIEGKSEQISIKNY